jgi:hypothetical protein
MRDGARCIFPWREHGHLMRRDVLPISRSFAARVRARFKTTVIDRFRFTVQWLCSSLYKADRERGFRPLPLLFQSSAFVHHFCLLPKEPFVFLSHLLSF